LVRRRSALRVRDRTPGERRLSAFWPALPSHSIVRRRSLRGAAQFALLGPGGVDVAIRWRPLRLIRSSRTLCPRAETYFGSKPSKCVCSATSCDVLDADPSRALFSCRRW
jgi:hypothetical protein